MSAFVAIFAIFIISALGVLAALVYFMRQRMLQAPKPHRGRAKRRKQGEAEPEPEPEPELAPLKQGRSRLISASSLAEAEAANSDPDSTLIEPLAPEPEPAPLAPEPERHAPLAAAARQAIVFRQLFPPHLATAARSFFGGAPVVQGAMEWPRDPASGAALHFLVQVDLAEVPAEARLGLLPDGGVLAVFLDLTWGAGEAFRVVWQQGYAGMEARELDVPSDLALPYGDEAAQVWPWALSPAHGIQLLPRWPFEPVVIMLPEPPDGVWPQTGALAEATAQALLSVQDAGMPGADLAPPLGRHDFIGADGASFVPLWPGFPQDWLAIQTVSAALVREADRALHTPRPELYPDLDEAARNARLKLVREEAQAWFDHALRNPALGSVAAPLQAAFWDWFAGHRPLAEAVAPAAAEAALETTLHAAPHEAALIPPEVTARLAYRHVLAQRSADGIAAPVPDRMLAPASAAHELAATHLLLLELATNDALAHRFGAASYQFWITPEDLADRRFDAVMLTRAAD